jgi:lysophospholipase L1-like esterase
LNTGIPLLHRWLKVVLAIAAGSLMVFAFLLLRKNGLYERGFLVGLLALLLSVSVILGKRFLRVYKSSAMIVLNTLLLIMCVEVAAAAILWVWNDADDRNARATQTFQPGQPWGPGYLDEFRLAQATTYEPYVIWKTRSHQGQYINIDQNGNRVTPAARCDKDSYVVFVFGGSTVWGTGVPDWGTVPAYLQRELTGLHKEPVCVRNLGQLAWVSTQSVIELLRHLQTGDVPNLVIFYDGFNDVVVLSDEGVAGDHAEVSLLRSRVDPEQRPRPLTELLLRTDIFRLLQKMSPSLTDFGTRRSPMKAPANDAQVRGGAIARAYLTNYRTVRALAGGFGFDYAFFWQPNPSYTKKPLTSEEKETTDHGSTDLMKASYLQVHAYTKDHDHMFYIADLFDHTDDRVYIDEVHLTPAGNEAVARRMMECLTRLSSVPSDRDKANR